MAKIKDKKNTQVNNSDKLKIMKELRTCMVVLHNIALDKDLVQLYKLHLPGKEKEHSPLCTNTSKSSSNNVWMLKENMLEDNTIENETPRLTRSRLKKLTGKKNESKNLEFLDNTSSYNYHEIIEPGAQKQQLKHDTSVKSLSNKSYDETSGASSLTYCNHTQEKTVPKSNKKHCSSKKPKVKRGKWRNKRKIYFDKLDTNMESTETSSNGENYLDEENEVVTNYNSKMQEISSESIKKYNNNLSTVPHGIINGTVCEVRLEREKNLKVNLFSNDINTDIENKISGTSEDIKADFKFQNTNSNNFFTIYHNVNKIQDQEDAKSSNETTSLAIDSTVPKTNYVIKTYVKKRANNKMNNKKTKSLPKITGDLILPKGTIKIMKVNKETSDESLQSSVSDQEQNRYNDTNSNIKQVSYIDDTLESTNSLREKKYHTSEINESTDTLKISKSTSALNNNIDLKNKNIDNELHSTKIDHKNVNSLIETRDKIHNVNANDTDSETMETYENCTLNHQKQSNISDDDEEHESNKKYNEINSDENILNKDNSDLMNTSESNINRSLFVSREEAIRKNRKRIAEENTIDIELAIKKKKLNRTIYLNNNVTYAKPSNRQQFNDFLNIDTTVESNMSEENGSEQTTDLREHLNQKRSKQSPKPSIFKNEFNNRNSAEKQIDLNNKNDIIIPKNVAKNKKVCKRLFFETESTSSKTLYKEKDIQTNPVCNNHMHCNSTLQSTSEKPQHIKEIDKSIHKNTNIQEEHTKNRNEDDDDDCISLFAESFDTNLCENTFLSEPDQPKKSRQSDVPYIMTTGSFNKYIRQNATEFNKDQDQPKKSLQSDVPYIMTTSSFNKYIRQNATEFNKDQDQPKKSLQSDVPYIMTTSSFNKYIRQNATEFNKEYAKCIENSKEMSNETDGTRREFNNQSKQTIHSNCEPETRTASKLVPLEIKNEEISKCSWSQNTKFVIGYCFSLLRRGICHKQCRCTFNHDLQNLINTVCSDLETITDIIQEALHQGFTFFCRSVYIVSLQKLTVNQILIIYQMLHNIRNSKDDLSLSTKKFITLNIVKELINRQMSTNTIVNRLVEYIEPLKNSGYFMNILTSIEKYIKRGEYWNTVKTLILRLPPDKRFINKILLECIENEKLIDIQDVNNNLIDKVSPMLISTLDKDLMERFKSLWVEKTAKNFHPAILVQNFGENFMETIASPDGSMNLSETESPRHDSTFINKIKDRVTEVNGEVYAIRPIDDVPDARSVYRDHEYLWKFYVDLDRFKKGLIHQDYDYVIKILKKYAEKKDESPLFVRSCCSILRTEIKRSEYHLTNIMRRTVQMGTFDILGKILFDIGLDILTSLVDQEAWGLALWLIQSLNIHNLPCNAEYFLLSAEIYLANKKAVKACDLLKYKNIICTSRDKWYVKSTINDGHVRSKIIHILLDSFCNEFDEHAFFLFQFLLKDQCSQYYPIDLSRYVDKLIMLSVLKKDTNLITEMANLVLKYTFALSTTTCRALISTIIHTDENLARQIYNYAESIGIYPSVKLWPITYIIINTDLTEEEIYLTFLQLLKNIVINFGHAIEFAKSQQIKVYLILEIKLTNEQFYCAELQNHNNNKAITNIKTLVRNVLKKRFDPPILLMRGSKGRIYKLQSKSLINYLKSEHCN